MLCRLVLRFNVFWYFIFVVCLSSCIPLHSCLFHHFMYRSQVRLQRFGDQLVSDISKIGANEEDLSIDIVSNGENTGLLPIVKHNVEHTDASSHRKRLHIERDALEDLKQGSSYGKYSGFVFFNSFWIPEILYFDKWNIRRFKIKTANHILIIHIWRQGTSVNTCDFIVVLCSAFCK